MTVDSFLLSFLLTAGRGRCKYVIKAAEIEGVVDNWLYSFSGVTREQRDLGRLTKRQQEKLEQAADILNRFVPMFVEQPEDGSYSPHIIDMTI
ncbi:hypothetical protein [Bythopirellula goksoeyrii]|uniref:Uncharacterized protein n=1 Tax=Bythopirellula goksoeyrii TaxID=1400387 RepID=A0A5B9QEA3_9BACT|nr:hypothetical protein [Bythopirellula goksoeyrii]QEG35925.1 hypothetical protein Pr1d_32330 [Bythopirellula goksoeyrii]